MHTISYVTGLSTCSLRPIELKCDLISEEINSWPVTCLFAGLYRLHTELIKVWSKSSSCLHTHSCMCDSQFRCMRLCCL